MLTFEYWHVVDVVVVVVVVFAASVVEVVVAVFVFAVVVRTAIVDSWIFAYHGNFAVVVVVARVAVGGPSSEIVLDIHGSVKNHSIVVILSKYFLYYLVM